MKYQDKTRDELLVMYLKLETEHQALKNLHKRDGTAYVVSERSTELSRIEFPDGDDNSPLANRSKLLSDKTAGHKHLEEKLKESEEHFRNVFEQSIVGTSITTIDGRLQTNKAFCDILGYSNNELNNKSWTEITYPEDINANKEILNSILAGDTKSARWEKRYFHKNGNIIWVDVNTSLHRGKKDEPLYFITSILDITEQKKAEQELLNAKEKAEENEKFNRLVADNLVNGMIYQVVILDNNQRKFTYLSDSVTKFYGCSVEEALDDPNLI
jgi:PAS domain S-box-containing protein